MEQQEELMIRAITSSIPSSYTLITTPVKVTITLTYNDKRRRDLDGAAKAILDCMNNLIYKDDSLIHVLIMSKTIGCPKASTTITVEVL